jgi:hypothetical protein
MNEGLDGAVATTLTETIVSGGTFTDGATNATDAHWFNDATRGIVLDSPDANSFLAGTQGIASEAAFSWSIWAKTSDTTGHIMGSRSGLFHSINPDNYATDNTWQGAFSTDTSDNAWHHYAVVRSAGAAGNISIYVDGVEIDTATNSDAIDTAMRFGGDYHHWNEGVDALLSDTAVWDEAGSRQNASQI